MESDKIQKYKGYIRKEIETIIKMQEKNRSESNLKKAIYTPFYKEEHMRPHFFNLSYYQHQVLIGQNDEIISLLEQVLKGLKK